MWINTNEFHICPDVNVCISFEWWMQKTLPPTLDTQRSSPANLHRLGNNHYFIAQSDLTFVNFASFIISYSLVFGCLYPRFLHPTQLNSSCTLLILSPTIYKAVNLCMFLKNNFINWALAGLLIIARTKRIRMLLRDFVYVSEVFQQYVSHEMERLKNIYI